ncbi:hypothetical protein BG003_007160 [Podila horticola]|nr:hypothetical protein BG003_007160 [Podila horticola]
MKLTPLAIASLLVLGSVKADAFVDDALAAHNEVRKEYGVPAYVWSTALANDATDFVQLVWKSSKEVGCAQVQCPENETPTAMVVCRYSPAGNTAGEYKDNVPKPASK